MLRTYLLTEEEVRIIEEKAGIKLSTKPEKHDYWDYAHGDIDAAVSMLDENDFSEEVLEKLRNNIDEMTQKFLDEYMLPQEETMDSEIVTDAMDEIFKIVVQMVDETACEIRDEFES